MQLILPEVISILTDGIRLERKEVVVAVERGGGDITPPTTPTNVICTTLGNDNTPSFSWTKSTDASGISGYYVKIDSGTDTSIGNVTSWTSSNIVADGTHTFYVKAKDAKWKYW